MGSFDSPSHSRVTLSNWLVLVCEVGQRTVCESVTPLRQGTRATRLGPAWKGMEMSKGRLRLYMRSADEPLHVLCSVKPDTADVRGSV
jgi:hypothetical protein